MNQSGASSKEVGDIDVFCDGNLYYSIEVKDKNFNEHDVEHAFNKVFHKHGEKAASVYGIRANFDDRAVSNKVREFEEKGLFVILQNINMHIKYLLFRLPSSTKQDFIKCLLATSESVNCKEETKLWMSKLFLELQWKNK